MKNETGKEGRVMELWYYLFWFVVGVGAGQMAHRITVELVGKLKFAFGMRFILFCMREVLTTHPQLTATQLYAIMEGKIKDAEKRLGVKCEEKKNTAR